MRAQLTVTPVKEDELIATITNPEKAQIHTTLPTGTDYEIPQGLVQYTPFTLSKEPFVIKLQNGVVSVKYINHVFHFHLMKEKI